MSDYFDPYDADRPLRLSCSCGVHANEAEHAAATLRQRSDSAEFEAYSNEFVAGHADEGAVPAGRAAAPVPARRGPAHGDGGHRQRAAHRQPAGHGAGQERAREEGPEDRLHPHHLRHAADHGAPAGLLFEAGAERRGGQDGRLGADPRQDAQQGVRRHALPEPDAAGHQHGPGLDRHADARGHHPEHQRPGHHAGQQAQGQARSQAVEGLQVRRALRISACTTSCCATTWPKRG